LQRAQDRRIAIRRRPDAVNEIRAGQLDVIFGNGARRVIKQRAGVCSQQLFYLVKRGAGAFELRGHLNESS
jgi:hypothetical protein